MTPLLDLYLIALSSCSEPALCGSGEWRGWPPVVAFPPEVSGRKRTMSYDLVIKNGTVVDGTGAARYQADVAIVDGKVAEIGKVTEGAKRTIDAHGLVVAPGFVD
eukprot:gene11603-14768_t